jgi:predicted porin
MALAIAAAIAPSLTHAQAGPVTLYGTLFVNVESVRASGSTTPANDFPARNRVSSNSSNFGFRATEKLGGGLDAWFQIEMGSVAVDAGGGALAGRNSAVGLRADWGSILLGQWDTPYKNATSNLDPFGNTSIAGYTNIMGGGTTSTSNNAATRQGFDRRQRNVVQYWTPDFKGFVIRTAYAANEERDTCGATVRCSPSLVSASASYRSGELDLSAATERHNQYANTTTATTKDTGMKLGARYKFGPHGIAAVIETLKFQGNLAATALPKTFTVGAATEAKQKSMFVGYRGEFGVHNVRLSYVKAKDLELNNGGTAPNTNAKMMAMGYGYDFSKRTEGVIFYTKITNASASRHDFAVNGLIAANNNGADPRGIAIGIKHRF